MVTFMEKEHSEIATKEEAKLLLNYGGWLSSNVVSIDRSYNQGDFIKAHLGIGTLYANMRAKDREGFLKFIAKHQDRYEISPYQARECVRSVDVEPDNFVLESEQYRKVWKNMYMAQIDFFDHEGYIFKTRKFQAGQE